MTVNDAAMERIRAEHPTLDHMIKTPAYEGKAVTAEAWALFKEVRLLRAVAEATAANHHWENGPAGKNCVCGRWMCPQADALAALEGAHEHHWVLDSRAVGTYTEKRAYRCTCGARGLSNILGFVGETP